MFESFSATDSTGYRTTFIRAHHGGLVVTVYGPKGAIRTITELKPSEVVALRQFLAQD